MTFKEVVENYKGVVLKKYAVFNGRAGRREFWLFVLASMIISAALGLIGRHGTLQGLYNLAVLLPSLGVGVRRLHDIGKSGWWMLINIIPIIGWIIYLVWIIKEGQPGNNMYGSDPKGMFGGMSTPASTTTPVTPPTPPAAA